MFFKTPAIERKKWANSFIEELNREIQLCDQYKELAQQLVRQREQDLYRYGQLKEELKKLKTMQDRLAADDSEGDDSASTLQDEKVHHHSSRHHSQDTSTTDTITSRLHLATKQLKLLRERHRLFLEVLNLKEILHEKGKHLRREIKQLDERIESLRVSVQNHEQHITFLEQSVGIFNPRIDGFASGSKIWCEDRGALSQHEVSFFKLSLSNVAPLIFNTGSHGLINHNNPSA